MQAFLDPSIKGIIANIGGDDALRLIPFLDLDIIHDNPKVFLGYSDTTVIHFACLKAGLRTFYGPSVLTGFAENVAMHDYTVQGIQKTLFSSQKIGAIPDNLDGWTKEHLDWANPQHQNIRRVLQPPLAWRFLGSSEKSTGHLIGGCMDVMMRIKGTPLWANLNVWEGAILFQETSETGMPPNLLGSFLRSLGAQGILQKLKGILFSKPGGPHVLEEDFCRYETILIKVLKEFKDLSFPVVTQMDFGHSDPMWPLPYGASTEINPETQTVTILESGVLEEKDL
jgi:muramoyltetrapeptide carboxypeptidase LdcA involved in peptidoglycan recycling